MSTASKSIERFLNNCVNYLIEEHPLPIWMIDAQGFSVKYANASAITFSGYSTNEYRNNNFIDLLSKESGEELTGRMRSGPTGSFAGNYDLKEQTKQVRAKLVASAFTFENDNYYQIMLIPASENSGETKGQHESVSADANDSIGQKVILLADLVEQTSDILTAADLDFRSITWNKASERAYGLKAEQVIGKDISQLVTHDYFGATHDEVRTIIKEQGEWRGEASFMRHGDQKQVTLWITFKLMKDASDNAVGYLISGTDMTERKEADLRLKESDDRFRIVADSAPVMIWMSDADNKITYVNKPWEQWTGVDLLKLKSIGWINLLHPDDAVKTTEKFDEHFANQTAITITYRLRQKNGEYRWVQETGVPRKLTDGTFLGFIGSVIDIHDQKKKEEQLCYQARILETVSDIIVTTDLKFKVKSWNSVAEQYFGITAKDALGKQMNALVHFTFYGTSIGQSAIDLETNGIWKGEVSFTDKNGETRYFLYTVKYVINDQQNKTGFVTVGRDITDRKTAEEKLVQSEQFYRTLIADSSNGTILTDASGIITFSSPSVKDVLGFDAEEIEGRNAFEFVHTDDITWAIESFQREVSDNPEVKSIVVRLLKKDGEWLWCMVRGHNLLNNPYVNSIVIYFHDDSLRKKTNDALKESEKRFRDLIRDLQIGVILQDKDGKTLMCNQAMADILLTSEEDLYQKNIYEIAGNAIREDGTVFEKEERPTYKAIATKKPSKDVVIGIYRPKLKDRIWVIINADPVLDENGELLHIICSVKDITERKKLEEELLTKQIKHQKQLTLATIDGQEKERREIGKELHDNIGQQLTTIKLFLDLAKGTADEATNEMISMSLKGVSDVINEVRSMSRSLIPSTLKDLGLIESINELIETILRTQLLKIDLNYFDFDEDKLQENQRLTLFRIIQEQLNNIVKHAEARNVSISLTDSDSHITLQIKDDGNGFDLKSVRKGLGFMNIKNRAELFGGSAQVISQPGKGCLLKVSFPQKMAQALAGRETRDTKS